MIPVSLPMIARITEHTSSDIAHSGIRPPSFLYIQYIDVKHLHFLDLASFPASNKLRIPCTYVDLSTFIVALTLLKSVPPRRSDWGTI